MQLSQAAREADGGRTEVTIADGLIYIDIFRKDHHIEQHSFEAKDLIDKNIDRLLMSSGVCWSLFKEMMQQLMKVGDLVIRKVNVGGWKDARKQREQLGHGVILSKQMAGRPKHSCISVYYPKVGKIYDIAESLMEVINESR